jgi:hypothetical protein
MIVAPRESAPHLAVGGRMGRRGQTDGPIWLDRHEQNATGPDRRQGISK